MAENAAIIYMSRMRDVPLLYRSLTLLGMNFSKLREYPVVILHDDIDRATISNLMVALHRNLGFIPNLKFERLEFKMPEWVSEDPAKYTVPLEQAWMGYRHMCRYHSGGIYRDERLLKYDWYWRLDSDSYIFSPINYDPFEYMASNGKEYAYMSIEDGEVPSVVEGLWDETARFMEEHSIPLTRDLADSVVDGKWSCRLFYTNFEIAKFSFFRSKEYMSYFDHLDRTGNIFYRRWGDAPIHWLGVKMFLPTEKVWGVKDITYQHNAWVQNLSAIPNRQIDPRILQLLEGDDYRRNRLLYAMDRYNKTGIDRCNWGE